MKIAYRVTLPLLENSFNYAVAVQSRNGGIEENAYRVPNELRSSVAMLLVFINLLRRVEHKV